MRRKKVFLSVAGIALLTVLGACSTRKPEQVDIIQFFPKPDPKGYVCYRAAGEIFPDGKLSEKDWNQAPWTDYFADIEGSAKPAPRFKTRAKMLWDDQNLYIAAELEEPHLWATLKQRDTVVFYDHDFEVFIDPDGDTHAYYELEVNALGTAWDLLLLKPYRDGGPPVNAWDISGLQVGVNLEGTLNDPSDQDTGWTVEMVLPLNILKECAAGGRVPAAGDHWRINFSRVEWRTLVENGSYRKEINPLTGKSFPEDNWVWSPQGAINMHMPEMWGYLQFSGLIAGAAIEEFIPDPDIEVKWTLRQIYYAESEWFAKNQFFTQRLEELGLDLQNRTTPAGLPIIKVNPSSYEVSMPSVNPDVQWIIREDGKLFTRKEAVKILSGY